MSAKLVIYFTAEEHSLYLWSGGGLELQVKFAADEQGLGEFREYLKGHKGALAFVVADLAGEDFHEDQIPYLRGSDRQAVVERRLAQRYRDTRLAAALTLGYATGERRTERLLLASFTNTQQFTAWLDALAESGTRLSGVYSIPLLAPALAARLGVRGGRCFVVTANSTGLRQCYIEEGKLRFARLERTPELRPEALAAFVRAETLRLAQYLATLRALPRDGPPVQAIVVAPAAGRAAFEQALVSDARLAFHTLAMEEAARKVGLKHAARGSAGEQLFLHLAVRRPPKEQFARLEDRRSFFLWKLQRAVVAAGAIGFAACAAFAGVKWLDVSGVRDQIAAQRSDAREATQQYERITAAFPVTQTTSDNLKAAVVEFRNIAARSASPEGALGHLSRVLGQFPQIELDALAWSVGKPIGAREVKPAAPPPAPAAGAAAPTAGSVAAIEQILDISGRVQATQRSDYRAITEQVQRFAAALTADPSYRIVRTNLPFDTTPDATLSGDIGETAERGDAPRFTIMIARALR
ncbi:MAG: hypothetical protein ACREUO_11690 [Burkholderiales bacterium]